MVGLPPKVYGAVPPVGINVTLPVVCPLSVQTINVSLDDVVSVRLQQMVPVITPPGATQLEEAPVKAKFSIDPLLLYPLSSNSEVTNGLLPAAMPWLQR